MQGIFLALECIRSRLLFCHLKKTFYLSAEEWAIAPKQAKLSFISVHSFSGSLRAKWDSITQAGPRKENFSLHLYAKAKHSSFPIKGIHLDREIAFEVVFSLIDALC